MSASELHAVTGAYGYSGKYIAQRLLDAGHRVLTLTNSPGRPHPFGDRVPAYPFDFDHPERLAGHLRGVKVLYNTYWVRFNHRLFNQADAVRNTLTLFAAAREAGIERVVHVSITNPSEASALEYFRGKAVLERALRESGLSYAILRPAVLFGGEDILINNIAWMLRRFPIFGVFGDGTYRLQPIHVEDFADLAVSQGARTENIVVEAIGPETFTYRDFVRMIADALGKRRWIISVPPRLGLWAGNFLGAFLHDVMLTRDEIEGLMADLLYVDAPPAGMRRVSDWLRENASVIGASYASELARRVDRTRPYGARS